MALASAGARADGSTSGFLVAYRMLALVFHGVQQRAVRRVKFVVNALVPRGDPRSDRDVAAARSASRCAPCVHRAWRLHGRRRDLAKTYATSLRTRTRDRNGLRPRDTAITRRRARRASPAGRVDGSFNSLRFEGGFGRNRWSLALLLPGLATGHGSITTPKIVAYDGDAAPKAAFINEC